MYEKDTGEEDQASTEKILDELKVNKQEVIQVLSMNPKSAVQEALEELGAEPSRSSESPTSSCQQCGFNNWREHSIRLGKFVCTNCIQRPTEILKARLRKGVFILSDLEEALLSEGDPQEYVRLRETFSERLAKWSNLERELRNTCDYHGCIFVDRSCPDNSPVRCGVCE